MGNKPDLLVAYQQMFPKEPIDEFLEGIDALGLNAMSEARPAKVFAALEWALPTLVIAYLGKPYFEGFLQEAGKDHYQVLRAGYLKFLARIFGEKGASNPTQRSLLFSFQIVTCSGKSVKFVFPEGVRVDEYAGLVDKMHELILEDYLKPDDSALKALLGGITAPTNSYYVEFSEEKRNWVLIDPMMEIIHSRERQISKDDTD